MRRGYLLLPAGVLILALGFWVGRADAQTGAAPGSSQDPLASVSYVTQAISSALTGQVPALVSQSLQSSLPSVVTPLVQSTVQSQLNTALQNLPAGGMSVSVVSVPPGQELVAQAGSEFLLRGGTALVELASTAQGGFVDVTTGQDIAQGASVPQNQLLLASRSDGRAIAAVGRARALVLVIGAYTLQPFSAQ